MAIEHHFKKPFVQRLEAEWLAKAGITLSLLRLDGMHPEISGNKWFKLKENLAKAQEMNRGILLTFGGVWSNHLVATAATAVNAAFQSIGFVRGFENDTELTPTLAHCQSFGMQLKGLSRSDYRKKDDPSFLKKLQAKFPDAWIIPEGGNNAEGRAGAAKLAAYVPADVSHVAVAMGTGTTFCGLRNNLDSQIKILGFAPFRKVEEQAAVIHRFCPNVSWDSMALLSDKKWKGFARWDIELIEFMNEFYESFQVPLDVVYTAKLMYYLKKKIEENFFAKGSHLLAIHSGGLQGNASVKELLSY